MYRHLISVIVLTCFASGSACFADKVDDDYRFAIQLFERKDWKSASDQFKAVIDDHPDSPRAKSALFYYGYTLMEQEKFKEAREQLRAFTKASPESKQIPDAAYRIGECSFHVKDYPAAKTELQTFINNQPKHPLTTWALSYLGDTLLAMNDVQGSQRTFQQIIDKFPQSELVEDARWGLGRVYEKMDKPDEALKMFRQVAAEGKAFQSKAMFKVGMVHLEQKRPDEAAVVFEDFQKKYTKSRLVPLAALNAGLARYRNREYEKAVFNFQEIPLDNRYGAQAVRYSAQAKLRLKRTDEAIADLKRARTQFGKQPAGESVTYTLADVYRVLERYPEAMNEFVTVKQNWPNGTYAAKSLHLAAECALFSRQAEKCAELLDEFDATYTNASRVLTTRNKILRARMLLSVGEFQNQSRAIRLLKEAGSANSDTDTSNLAMEWRIRGLRALGEHKNVVSVSRPLYEEIRKGNAVDFRKVLLLVASSAMQVGNDPKLSGKDRKKNLADAVQLSTDYINLEPKGKVAQAKAIRARSNAALGQMVKAMSDLDVLATGDPELHVTTCSFIANTAFDNNDFKKAADLFKVLADLPKANKARPRGLMDYGWSLLRLKQYGQAADQFKTLASDYPERLVDAAEASLLVGQCMKLANRKSDAVNAFTATYEKYRPAEKLNGEPGPATPELFALQAGKAGARLLGRTNPGAEVDNTTQRKADVEKADKIWESIVATYPDLKDLDVVLEDWAFLHLESENFEKSDVIFKKLIDSRPTSPRARRAKLALAESSLVNGNLEEAEKTFVELSKSTAEGDEISEAATFQLIRIAVDKAEWIKVGDRCADLKRQFPNSQFLNETNLRLGESHFNLSDHEKAVEILDPLRKQLMIEKPIEANREWAGRVWVVLAEIELTRKEYSKCQRLLSEIERVDAKSPFLHQAYELLGRTYIRKAPPNFDQARQAFTRATTQKGGVGSRTAAKAQFMIGESWLMEKQYDKALLAYLKVALRYKFPKWQAPALYQAAQCEESLKQVEKAKDNYNDLIKQFPDDDFAAKAKLRLKSLSEAE